MRLVLLGAVLLGTAPLLAQDSATAECAKLTAEHKTAQKGYSAKLRELTQTEEYKAAAEERDRAKIEELRKQIPPVDTASFVTRFKAGADKYAGKEGATGFLAWLAKNAPKEESRAAVAALFERHLQSPTMEDVLDSTPAFQRHHTPDEMKALLEKAIDGSKKPLAKAQAMVALAGLLAPARSRNPVSDEDKQRAEELKREALTLAPDTPLAWRIEGPQFEKDNLAIGMKAPDIKGEDLDGVSFKLSDYRGKVVVLDFWGDW
jgi:hypothetical protein